MIERVRERVKGRWIEREIESQSKPKMVTQKDDVSHEGYLVYYYITRCVL